MKKCGVAEDGLELGGQGQQQAEVGSRLWVGGGREGQWPTPNIMWCGKWRDGIWGKEGGTNKQQRMDIGDVERMGRHRAELNTS